MAMSGHVVTTLGGQFERRSAIAVRLFLTRSPTLDRSQASFPLKVVDFSGHRMHGRPASRSYRSIGLMFNF
jgi:hypothetical protein